MLSVKQFRYGADNFSYILYGRKQAAAIDGGAGKEIIDFLNRQGLTLSLVTNTHRHSDHTQGNAYLLTATQAQFLDYPNLADNKEISLDGEKILIYRTPGHTDDSVCFHAGPALISGDTLFNGTIGNCFSGSLKNFYLSIRRLMALPDETIIYAGHDYVAASLAFARFLEPANRNIDRFGNSYDPAHVFSTMADERLINPYLRFNEEPILNVLKKRGLPCASEWERWESLMSIE
ncbi:MAG TPA: MBL fold metallo-hydrolase [Smithellaceae bacterium]|nr:MBL fold metallo-hydrolase [Smithellaceae bacterium]